MILSLLNLQNGSELEVRNLNMPKVSIITPTYNRAYVLWKTILSVQNQSFADWDLIIVDDNSSDDTEKLVRQFHQDNRIKLVKNRYSHSAAGARKTGCEHATGRYIAYLDSDNTANPDWLAVMFDRFRRYPKAMFAFPAHNTQMLFWDEKEYKLIMESAGFKELPTRKTLWQHDFEGDPNGLIHLREALSKIEGWDENLRSYEDYDYALQLSFAYPEGILFVPQVLINYARLYGEAGLCSDSTYDDIIKSLKYIDNKYKNHKDWQAHNSFGEKLKRYELLREQGYTPLKRVIEKFGIR